MKSGKKTFVPYQVDEKCLYRPASQLDLPEDILQVDDLSRSPSLSKLKEIQMAQLMTDTSFLE